MDPKYHRECVGIGHCDGWRNIDGDQSTKSNGNPDGAYGRRPSYHLFNSDTVSGLLIIVAILSNYYKVLILQVFASSLTSLNNQRLLKNTGQINSTGMDIVARVRRTPTKQHAVTLTTRTTVNAAPSGLSQIALVIVTTINIPVTAFRFHFQNTSLSASPNSGNSHTHANRWNSLPKGSLTHTHKYKNYVTHMTQHYLTPPHGNKAGPG